MKRIIEENQCVGCGACVDICPVSAVEMRKDEKGFLYGVINEDRCVSCGACVRVCTLRQNVSVDKAQKFYILKATDEEILKKSSSGGAFTAFSDLILDCGGCIYGCAFDCEGMPRHIRAEDRIKRNGIRGAKYVQSNLEGIYNQVKDDLKNGKKVLFTGTPCQVDSIKGFLKIKKVDVSNLYTIDFICHGVPSRKIWKEYLLYLKKRYKSSIISLSFRNKNKNSNSQELNITFDNGKVYNAPSAYDLFYYAFLNNYILRDSCYECKYCSFNRTSDITVGDFGDDKPLKIIQRDYLRESSVIVNTQKGTSLLEKLTSEYKIEACSKERISQNNLVRPTEKPSKYDKFWNCEGNIRKKVWKVADSKNRILFVINRLGLIPMVRKLKRNIK